VEYIPISTFVQSVNSSARPSIGVHKRCLSLWAAPATAHHVKVDTYGVRDGRITNGYASTDAPTIARISRSCIMKMGVVPDDSGTLLDPASGQGTARSSLRGRMVRGMADFMEDLEQGKRF